MSYDQDPVDYTLDPNQALEDNPIRLHSGLDIRSLINDGTGTIFEPEVDERLFEDLKPEDRNYFMTQDKEFEAKLERLHLDDEPSSADVDDSDETMDFAAKSACMDRVTEDGGIKKRILFHGLQSTGRPPKNGTVTIHYSLYLEDQDEPYDSTILRGRPERFKLDDGRLFPGIELAVKSMLAKERSEFLIQPQYAFGDMGCPPRVPQKAEILAKIELLNFVQEAEAEALLCLDPEERAKAKSFDEIIKVVKIEHTEGNNLVRAQEWKNAIKRYERGIKLLEDVEMKDEEEERRQQDLLRDLQLNRAHCSLKVGWPKKACIGLQKALEIDPRNVKANFRMAKAKRMLGHLEDAMKYLKRADLLSSSANADIGQEMRGLSELIKREKDAEKAMCTKMFVSAQNSPASDPKVVEEDVDEDFCDEMKMRLEGFLLNANDTSLPLPKNFTPAEIRMTKSLASDMNMKVEKITLKNSQVQWTVLKD
ncbi:hypothetical protein TCAL_01858 [Tigriopus californicus]|uniref:peptidylprolyl isomerase n=1 Tax=Tigriopus californicus TaxID=6832 RepID=A0A553NG36_TIGCA|nr:inactive peptidyl-prolyl cis-trans isomerase FKBP6-like [Tigriopus californicus]TRY64381.1 hypothetical protein TCAL_01858 [Tigriopus californicus]|eukprot:TCALIF_01858-PA protein Name:"Similar to FKBP6 Inactive peptidyl-prolyl cis-trans isomerase FKBP6 (Equus caballus)" AED:0.01 eAED:0.01 QI:149/1/1/1/1/1/5/106/479